MYKIQLQQMHEILLQTDIHEDENRRI